VCLKWEAEDTAADSDVDGFQLLVDAVPVGEPLKKSARQVTIDELKPGQELDISLLPLDASRQPLSASNVVKACDHKLFSVACTQLSYYIWFLFNRHSLPDLLEYLGFVICGMPVTQRTASKH